MRPSNRCVQAEKVGTKRVVQMELEKIRRKKFPHYQGAALTRLHAHDTQISLHAHLVTR